MRERWRMSNASSWRRRSVRCRWPRADRLSARAGDAIELTIGSRRVAARVAGIIEVPGVARAQLTDLIVADLATAQELAGLIGRLDRIDVSLEHDADEAALAAALP